MLSAENQLASIKLAKNELVSDLLVTVQTGNIFMTLMLLPVPSLEKRGGDANHCSDDTASLNRKNLSRFTLLPIKNSVAVCPLTYLPFLFLHFLVMIFDAWQRV